MTPLSAKISSNFTINGSVLSAPLGSIRTVLMTMTAESFGISGIGMSGSLDNFCCFET